MFSTHECPLHIWFHVYAHCSSNCQKNYTYRIGTSYAVLPPVENSESATKSGVNCQGRGGGVDQPHHFQNTVIFRSKRGSFKALPPSMIVGFLTLHIQPIPDYSFMLYIISRELRRESIGKTNLAHLFCFCLFIYFWTLIYLHEAQIVRNVMNYPLADVKLVDRRKIKLLMN